VTTKTKNHCLSQKFSFKISKSVHQLRHKFSRPGCQSVALSAPEIFRNVEALLWLRLAILGRSWQDKGIARILFNCLVNVGLRIGLKLGPRVASASRSEGASLGFRQRSDLRGSHFGHARIEQTLAPHLLTEGERPHPKFAAQDLLHVLQPEHVIVVRLLQEPSIGSTFL